MPQKTDSNSLAQLLGSAVESDPELRDRVKSLISAMLDHAEYTMRWGTSYDRTAMMRAAIPAMMRALQRTEEDEVVKAQQAALSRIYASLTAGKK